MAHLDGGDGVLDRVPRGHADDQLVGVVAQVVDAVPVPGGVEQHVAWLEGHRVPLQLLHPLRLLVLALAHHRQCVRREAVLVQRCHEVRRLRRWDEPPLLAARNHAEHVAANGRVHVAAHACKAHEDLGEDCFAGSHFFDKI